jgi:putative oxidoreductase
VTTAQKTGATGRVRNIAFWVLQAVVAGLYLMSAMGKFSNAEPAASTFEAIGWGVLETAGAAALFVPPLAGAAALAFVVLMVCATLTEQFVSGGGVVLPLALLVLSAAIAWGRRASTARLWARISGA